MSKWQAFEVIELSINETKKLLFPIRRAFWFKLALVTLLGGVGSGGSGFNFGNPFQSLGNTKFQEDPELLEIFNEVGETFFQNIGYILLAIGLVLVLILALSFISSVFKFVFFQDVIEGGVELISDFKSHLRSGLSLFIFRIVLIIVTLILLAIGALPFILTLSKDAGPIAMFASVMIGLIFVITVGLISALINLFAIDFVVPIMVLKNTGIWSGFMNTLSTISKNRWQFVVYIILRIVLGIVGGILNLLLLIPLGLIWLIFLGILGIGIWIIVSLTGITISSLGIVGWMFIFLIIFSFVILFSYSLKIVTLPIQVFIRLYSFTFLITQNPNLTEIK